MIMVFAMPLRLMAMAQLPLPSNDRKSSLQENYS